MALLKPTKTAEFTARVEELKKEVATLTEKEKKSARTRFSVNIDPAVQRQVKIRAAELGISISDLVEEAVKKALL